MHSADEKDQSLNVEIGLESNQVVRNIQIAHRSGRNQERRGPWMTIFHGIRLQKGLRVP